MIDLPKFNEFFTPILQLVSKVGEINAHEAVDLVIKNVGLNEEQLSLKQESNGRPLAKNRVHWACSYLYKAGGLTRPKRGFIDVGVNTNHFLNLKRPVDLKDIRSTNEWKKYEEEKANRILIGTNNSANIYSGDETPEDLIDKGKSLLELNLIDELIENMKSISPADFEELILKLLARMGYGGGDPKRIRGVPRGPDGGIDGTVDEDRLGLSQIYIQAKRFSENSVGRPTVQSFIGAMTGGGCRKGVFVTSSTFTSEAKKFAEGLNDVRLVLIDGFDLAKLMIEHSVGVQVKETIRVAKIDQDFFNGDE